MKKYILILFTSLLFNCGNSGDGSDDDFNDTAEVSFFDELSNDDTASIITTNDTYSFENYRVLNDENIDFKSIAVFNGFDTDATLTVNLFFEADTNEVRRIHIVLNIGLTESYTYSNTVFQDDDPQDIDITIEDTDTSFKISFDGVLSSPISSNGEYTTLNISNAVIDIEL